MKKKARVGLWGALTGLCAILLVASFVGNYFANLYATTLNVVFDTGYIKMVNYDPNAIVFKSDFENDDARWEYEKKLCADVEAEGAALLLNENGALPLAGGARVSLFARGSVDLMYGGTGSGSVDTSQAPTLKDALTGQGVEVNQSLWDWYVSTANKYGRVTPAAISDALAANTQYGVNEAPWSEVSTANGGSFADYGDAAIVVFSRSGGEGADLPDGDPSASLVTSTEVTSQVGDSGTAAQGSGGTAEVKYGMGAEGDGDYLSLSKEERDLLAGLKELKDNGTFKKIVVLLNTSNAIELDFLNPSICGEDYGIDACMWVGDVGQTGANGVGRLLVGETTPSGSLVDTYWYDNMLNPAVVNFYSAPY